jgi:hypothetical protein
MPGSEEYCSEVLILAFLVYARDSAAFPDFLSSGGLAPSQIIRDIKNGSRMPAFVCTCPITKLDIYYWLDDCKIDDVSDTEYEAMTCKACAKVHLINRKTGKLLGQEDPPEPI